MRCSTTLTTVLGAALVLGACGGSPGASVAPLEPTGFQEEALRRELQSYADRVMGEVVRMSAAVLAADTTPGARAFIQTLRADMAATSVVVAVEPDAETALQDLMVSMATRRAALDAAAPPFLDADAMRVVQATLDGLAGDIWAVGRGFYSPDELMDLEGRVEAWAKDAGPGLPTGVVRVADLPSGSGPGLGKGLFAPLNEANRQIQETRLLGERAVFLAQRLPVVALWQAEALTWEILAAPDARQALGDVRRISASMERLATDVDSLPLLIDGQRDALLAAFDEREGTLRTLLDEAGAVVREADALAESGTRVATLTKDAAASLDETLASAERLVSALRDAEAPGGAMSFEVEDYTAALGDFKAATEALNAALVRAEGLSGTPREIIDHAAWRAAQLLVLLFVLLAAYRFGPALVRGRSQASD